MLIKNDKLDVEEFKKIFNDIKWLKLPRKLGPDHAQHFYVGNYEDNDKIIQIKVRPSLRMQISESFKNRLPKNGEIPQEGYKGELCTWGTTVEVIAADSILNKIINSCEELPVNTKQVIEW